MKTVIPAVAAMLVSGSVVSAQNAPTPRPHQPAGAVRPAQYSQSSAGRGSTTALDQPVKSAGQDQPDPRQTSPSAINPQNRLGR